MRYHSFDEEVLHTTPGDFTITAEVPEQFNVPNNPDGTPAQMTAEFEGETLFASTAVAAAVGQDREEIISTILQAAIVRLKLSKPLDDESFHTLHQRVQNGEDLMNTDDPEVLQEFERFFDEYIGWEQLNLNFSAQAGDEDKEYSLKLSLHAPGYSAMASLLNYATKGTTLTNAVAAFMPLDETMHGEEQ